MARLPFSIFKREGRRFFYVHFKGNNGDYLPAISTKQTTEALAIEIAFKWLREGIPIKKAKTNNLNNDSGDISTSINLSLRESMRGVKTTEEVDFICRELKRQGFLKTYVITKSQQAKDFNQFLQDFWEYDTSSYIKEKLRKNHSIHRSYTKDQKLAVEKFWHPFFRGRLLGDITREDIERFMDNLDILAKRTLSAGRKNSVLKAGTIPLRWAFAKELIEKDVTKGIVWFSGKPAERQILSPEIAQAIFQVQWLDERARLANMLAAVTGLRAGEIQGLRVQDLGQDCLYIRHSWNFRDKLKTTKNNDDRTVELPFPSLINDLINLAKGNPHGTTMDSYVFWAEKSPTKPMEACLFVKGLRDALSKTGMNEESSNVYVFHGWRHFFTSYMREKVNEKLLRSQTGHKSIAMLEHYSGHTIAGDRERIRQAQRDVFGALVPGQ